MRPLTAILLFACAPTALAQTPRIHVDAAVQLPKDDVRGAPLVACLAEFLAATQKGAQGNPWVFEPERLETTLLVKEIEHLVQAEPKSDSPASQPHLCNVTPLTRKRHFIQLSFLRSVKGNPTVEAAIELIAHESKDGYVFSSPLTRSTKHWSRFELGSTTFHYRGTMDFAKAREYQRLAGSFDERLGRLPSKVSFYFFDDDLEARHALGLPHMSKYNGKGGSTRWSATLKDQEIYFLGGAQFATFDPHDLWHNRLSKVKPRKEVNHAVDEGIATLYGGSWGLTWAEMFAAFQEQIDLHPDTDWLDLRAKKVSFETRGHGNPTDFMVNALIVQRIEKTQGFAGVWSLLNAKGEEPYFKELTRLTGISRQNYNQRVWELLAEEIEEQKQ